MVRVGLCLPLRKPLDDYWKVNPEAEKTEDEVSSAPERPGEEAMKGRFHSNECVRLRVGVSRGRGIWPVLYGKRLQLVIRKNLTEDLPDEPARYLCEFQVGGTKLEDQFLEGCLEPWSHT
jgi:hypothetical protein